MRKAMAIIAAASLLVLDSCGLDDPVVTVNNSEDVTAAVGSATELRTDISVGDIEVSYGENKDAEIHVDYKIQGITQNKVSTVSEHLSCKAEVEDGVLVVSIVDPESGKSFWEWKNSNAKAVDVEADVRISLPESFNKFDINADVGNVDIDGLNGEFSVKCDVGNVEMTDIAILADSEISVDVGNADISLAEVGECEAKVSVDVGDITFDAGDLKCETITGDDDKPVGGKKELLADGKCTVRLRCDVGSIDLGQEDKNV